MAWITSEELRLALGGSTFDAIFDDGTGTPVEAAVTQVLAAAHADLMRFALRGWDGPIPEPPPDELKFLELDFARARAFFRGDSYTRDAGKEIWSAAKEAGKEIAGSLQRAGVDMPNPTPALASLDDELPSDRSSAGPFRGGTTLACTDSLTFWRKEGRC